MWVRIWLSVPLIKNPGGGLAPIGGYVAGRKDLIEQCAYRLTSPDLEKKWVLHLV